MLHGCQLAIMQKMVVEMLAEVEEAPLPLLLIQLSMILASDIPTTATIIAMSMAEGGLIEVPDGEGVIRRGENFAAALAATLEDREEDRAARDKAEVEAFLATLDKNDFNMEGMN